ncbi:MULTISPECIES: BCCT family transporter [Halomonas]|uniref:BCCT family transporter n=2 Tax=Halomonas TaxID=2745 RepID=A0AAU7KXQ4_9GAMM|nr:MULTISPECIES: BCCT family transporter [Halomonas]MAR71510.1 BCCT family transporter [Halomonas sp.]MBS8268531.1 BCCT family transporter [Halomonas litopenaei]MBY5941510.1 BCCT family transporter [Halomonas sp. DP5N14-9]MBY6108841.1 BCCT family transporter [Halomonas sp. DP1Y21-3]MCJ8286271.1 BCCT family transporter [Halomonas sp.]
MTQQSITNVESHPPAGPVSRIFGQYDRSLFWPVLLIYGLIMACALFFPTLTGQVLSSTRDFLIFNFGWGFLLGMGGALLFCLYLVISPYGDLKLGADDEVPEFSYGAWISMLFSCGFGIGFVFFSVAEPLTHLYQSSHVIDMGATGEAAGVAKAVQLTLLDWGMHGWAVFAIAAWAIAFPAYRLGLPLTVATGLYGILGERCNTSVWGRLANALGIIGTIGGNATMIGLGVASINYGLATLFGWDLGPVGQALVMIVVIVAYVISAATGVERGIKVLSQANMVMAGAILLALLFFGHAPTQYLLNLATQQVGDYFGEVFALQFWSDAGNFEQREWLGWWVVFYWLWYISYIPFCGGFIARISRGRTLREFIVGVILVPMLLAIGWFSIWGGSAGYVEVTGIAPLWEGVQQKPESGIYALLESMPGGWWLSLGVLFNIVIFAVTTSDSASFFAAMQVSNGDENPKVSMRLLWGVVIGFTGIMFQLTGGFDAIRSLAIVVGAPFFVVGIAYMVSVYRMLKSAKKGGVHNDRIGVFYRGMVPYKIGRQGANGERHSDDRA